LPINAFAWSECKIEAGKLGQREKEVWAECFTRLEAAGCQIKHETLISPVKTHPTFSIQEVASHA
jgi:hypothetical protein